MCDLSDVTISVPFPHPHGPLPRSAEQAAAGVDDGAVAEEGAAAPSSSGPAPPPFGLPTSLVKKIATMDPEVDRMGADAVRAVAKATALFVQALAAKALATAAGQKRKNFKFSDIEMAAKRDRRLVDVGLPELFGKDAAFAEVRARAAEEEERKARGGKKGAAEAEGEGGGAEGGPPRKKQARPLTDFFGGAAAAKDADSEEAPMEEDAGAGAAEEEVAEAANDSANDE